jgi:hypothetical protein
MEVVYVCGGDQNHQILIKLGKMHQKCVCLLHFDVVQCVMFIQISALVGILCVELVVILYIHIYIVLCSPLNIFDVDVIPVNIDKPFPFIVKFHQNVVSKPFRGIMK